MAELIVHIVVTALLLMVVAQIVPGIAVKGFGSALIGALILGVVNGLVRPLVVLLTLPLTILTLGLFLFVINGLMFLLASKLVPGFKVDGCLPAVLGSVILSLLNLAVAAVFGI